MANDRVMIKCDGCGAWKMLLKFFPGDLSTRPENGVLPWLDLHGKCHPHFFGDDLDGVIGFSLHLEGADALDPAKQNAGPP